MREILFRGKRKGDGEWVEGYLFDDGMVNSKRMFVGYIIIENFKGTDSDDDVTGTYFYEVDPETVCQYTGLTDKDGRKIFEGDIVKLEDYHGNRIVYVFYGNCGSWFYGSDGLSDEYIWNGNYKEIIGNTFDNPELLGES